MEDELEECFYKIIECLEKNNLYHDGDKFEVSIGDLEVDRRLPDHDDNYKWDGYFDSWEFRFYYPEPKKEPKVQKREKSKKSIDRMNRFMNIGNIKEEV